jgi:parallel beta-helix repeat protein
MHKPKLSFASAPVALLRLGLTATLLVSVSPSFASAQFSCPTTDDVQIQQLLDATSANGGGTVWLEAGVYHTCQTLVIGTNVHLRGAGRGATVIRGSTAIVGKVVGGAYIGATIGGAGVRNVSVSDLTVDHRTYNRNANGISFVPTGVDYTGTVPTDVSIERVEVLGSAAGYHNYLIWNLKGQHVKIRDNWLDGGYPIPSPEPMSQEGIESFGGYDVLITGNSVKGVGGACINLGSAGIPNSTTVGIVVSNNYLFGCTFGINLGTSSENGGQHNYESTIADNTIIYAASAGINITAAAGTIQRNLRISGNAMRVVGPGPLAAGIRIQAHSTADVGPVTVSDNQVHTVTGTHGTGIRLDSAPNVRLIENTISDTTGDGITVYGSNDVEVSRNRVERAGAYGIYVGPTALRPIVTDNLLADWSIGYPAVLLEGLRYGAIHRNLFRRVDGGQPAAIILLASCGVQLSDNQVLYAGSVANGASIPCQ